MKGILNYIDDILFTLGVIFLSLAGFMIYIPAGFIILGLCCLAYSFMFAKATAAKRGGR